MQRKFEMELIRFICVAAVITLWGAAGCVTAPRPATKQAARKAAAPTAEFADLPSVTDAFAGDLAEAFAERNLFLASARIRDIGTGDVSNFSAYLQNELESSLSKRGFNMVYDQLQADYLVGAMYKKTGSRVKIFFKYHKPDFSGRRSLAYDVAVAGLPRDSFEENLKSKAHKLAAGILERQRDLKIYIKPIKEGREKYVSDFSKSFTARVKTEIVRLYREIEVIGEKPIYERLSDTAEVKEKARQVEHLPNSDAYFAGADSVLEGEYFVEGDLVAVNLYLKKLDGRVLNSAGVDIDIQKIDAALENRKAKKLADLADVVTEEPAFNIKLSTTKGGDSPVYYAGEKIKFHVQVARPLYVYIYDINPEGRVALLYPYRRNLPQTPFMPRKLYTIPAEHDDFELEVKPPFGMDAVKMFAGAIQLPFPELVAGLPSKSYTGGTRAIVARRKDIQNSLAQASRINPRDLVDYYRGIARKAGTKVYENSVLVETKPR